MATLYELTGQFLDIYNMDLDDETKLDTLESIDWNEDYENKVENYTAWFLQHLGVASYKQIKQSQVEQADALIQKLKGNNS